MYIFVYGTLRRDIKNNFSNLLKKSSKFIGYGYVYAKLYEIDNYPGIKITKDKRYKVYGEVYKIYSKYILDKLDEYEECSHNFKKPHEYKRVLITVNLLNKKRVKAWIYQYNLNIDNLTLIDSGDYIKYLKSRSSV